MKGLFISYVYMYMYIEFDYINRENWL